MLSLVTATFVATLSLANGRSLRYSRQAIPQFLGGSTGQSQPTPVQPNVLDNPGRARQIFNLEDQPRPGTIFQLPGNYVPLGISSNAVNPALPLFPFNSNFGFGLRVNPSNRAVFDGKLGFPVIDQQNNVFYPFDLNGGLLAGKDDTVVNFGHQLSPSNDLSIPIAQIYPCLIGLCNPVNEPAPQIGNSLLGVRRRPAFAAYPLNPVAGLQQQHETRPFASSGLPFVLN